MTTDERIAGIREHGRRVGWSEEYIERLVACQRHCDAQPIETHVVNLTRAQLSWRRYWTLRAWLLWQQFRDWWRAHRIG